MGLSIEEQREKQRLLRMSTEDNTGKVKRLVGGSVEYLSKTENERMNKKSNKGQKKARYSHTNRHHWW